MASFYGMIACPRVIIMQQETVRVSGKSVLIETFPNC